MCWLWGSSNYFKKTGWNLSWIRRSSLQRGFHCSWVLLTLRLAKSVYGSLSPRPKGQWAPRCPSQRTCVACGLCPPPPLCSLWYEAGWRNRKQWYSHWSVRAGEYSLCLSGRVCVCVRARVLKQSVNATETERMVRTLNISHLSFHSFQKCVVLILTWFEMNSLWALFGFFWNVLFVFRWHLQQPIMQGVRVSLLPLKSLNPLRPVVSGGRKQETPQNVRNLKKKKGQVADQ